MDTDNGFDLPLFLSSSFCTSALSSVDDPTITASPVVPRPSSPLPPNVPTGPRSQNKYKDRDGNAAGADGLDYGGGGGGGTTPSVEPEERSSSRYVPATWHGNIPSPSHF